MPSECEWSEGCLEDNKGVGSCAHKTGIVLMSNRGIRTGRQAPDTFRTLGEDLKKHPRASLLLLRRVSEESVWARRMGTLRSPRDLRCASYMHEG